MGLLLSFCAFLLCVFCIAGYLMDDGVFVGLSWSEFRLGFGTGFKKTIRKNNTQKLEAI